MHLHMSTKCQLFCPGDNALNTLAEKCHRCTKTQSLKKSHYRIWQFNTLRPRQNGRHFADDILKCIFLNENVLNSIKISLKFIPKGPIHYIAALVQIMVWRRSGDKPLSEPVMIILLMHICSSRPTVELWTMGWPKPPCIFILIKISIEVYIIIIVFVVRTFDWTA